MSMPGSLSQNPDAVAQSTGPGAPQAINTGTLGSRYSDSGVFQELWRVDLQVCRRYMRPMPPSPPTPTPTASSSSPPAVQQMYADLIKRLDERRPQVQIECTIVTLDTATTVTFGIDISHRAAWQTAC